MNRNLEREIENLNTRCAELKEENERLKTGMYYAKKFAELVECWGRTECELYKHELKASADLQLERIAEALGE